MGMGRPRKFKAGEIHRGVKLIKETYIVQKRRIVAAWVCREVNGRNLSIIPTNELTRTNKLIKNKSSSMFNRVFRGYTDRCRRKNVYWGLSKDEFKRLSQLGCHYCQKPPSNGNELFKYNGLDRKNNKLGYSMDNVVPCCGQCNGIKSNILSFKEMIAAMRAIKKVRS